MQGKKKIKIPYFLTEEYALKEKKAQKIVRGTVGALVVILAGVLFVSKVISRR